MRDTAPDESRRSSAAPAARPPRAGQTGGGARPATGALPSPELARAFSRRLRAWYRRHGRDLPWRHIRDPYQILVSELMLQQTQVSRVLEFYDAFVARFPTLHAVARARPGQVREAWQGLGYYARAANLHRLARVVTCDGGDGRLPEDPAALRRLPGIGAYTAGAVASFAYERRAALVDTNVARVLARIFHPPLERRSPAALRRLWQIAETILPRRGDVAWTHNQALIELGATVCTARVRHCGICPAADWCARLAADRAVTTPPAPPGRRRPRGRRPSPPRRGA
ncbi:MAG TPA: hypothetical protein VLE53_15880 [Gemmatimonadaceae bacterium]|nr:hypothetical protein [Gemmatimonadaceae bacterium]